MTTIKVHAPLKLISPIQNGSIPFQVVSSPTQYPEIDKAKVLDTYKNLEWLLAHYKTEIRYNLMSRKREIKIPNHYIFSDDLENSSLGRINYLSTINGMPTKQLDKHLDILSFENPYHPIVECIKENPWDGYKRLDSFVQTIQTTDNNLSNSIIRTWMICAIAAAHSVEGFVNQGVLVLQGKQNIGKTRWVKSLDPINCNAVKEGALLDPSNKDSIILLARHWIAELGELDATFKKSDIARLKSFVTMQADDVRFAYAAKETRLARRTAYVATVNDNNFLSDETGNRRWWTISVEKINLDHGLDMKQIWSEVYEIWKKGAVAYLSRDLQEKVNDSNLEHEKIDPIKEQLQDAYDWESSAWRWAGATAVLIELGYNKPSKSDTTRMGNLLKELSKKRETRISRGCRQYQVPYLLIPKNIYTR